MRNLPYSVPEVPKRENTDNRSFFFFLFIAQTFARPHSRSKTFTPVPSTAYPYRAAREQTEERKKEGKEKKKTAPRKFRCLFPFQKLTRRNSQCGRYSGMDVRDGAGQGLEGVKASSSCSFEQFRMPNSFYLPYFL